MLCYELLIISTISLGPKIQIFFYHFNVSPKILLQQHSLPTEGSHMVYLPVRYCPCISMPNGWSEGGWVGGLILMRACDKADLLIAVTPMESKMTYNTVTLVGIKLLGDGSEPLVWTRHLEASLAECNFLRHTVANTFVLVSCCCWWERPSVKHPVQQKSQEPQLGGAGAALHKRRQSRVLKHMSKSVICNYQTPSTSFTSTEQRIHYLKKCEWGLQFSHGIHKQVISAGRLKVLI